MKKTIKKYLLLVLLFTLCTTISACGKKEDNVDVSKLDLYLEANDIRNLIFEAEKRDDLSDDAKEYLNLLKKNLVKMEIGFAYNYVNDLNSISNDTKSHYITSDTYKYCGKNEFFHQQINDLDENNKVIHTSENYIVSVDDYDYYKFIDGDYVSKSKTKVDSKDIGLSMSIDDMGLSHDLMPMGNENFLISIKKSVVDGKTVFTFKAVDNNVRFELTKCFINGVTENTVTFDKDGYLVSINEIESFTNTFDDGSSVVGNSSISITFTDLGIAQDINVPEDADEYESF